MEYSSLRVENDDGLVRLTLTQPDRGNPIDGDFCREFGAVADALSSDPGVRAVLISAEGKAFSFGGDIAAFVGQLDELPLMIRRWTADLHVGIARMQRVDAPIVAAIHGICAGGMAGLVAGADIVVADPQAQFVAAYAGIGFCNDAGSSIMYARRMGIARARRFLLLNQTLDAQAALEAGLVDEVTGSGEAHRRAEEVAAKLAKGPTRAFGEMRRLLASVEYTTLDSQLELEAQALVRVAGTADAREGLTAFAQRRRPQFRGE